jgi:AcrR family transcriptional regulator
VSDRPTYERQRSTAAQNRARLLDVAHDRLAANAAASMNEIAKAAGVGAGTLYRNFPTREDLILAVYHHDIERLVASVGDVLAANASAKAAFIAWFETLAAYIRVKHGLGEALHTAAAQDAINATYAPVTAAVARLLDACVSEGTVAPGHDAGDVLLLMSFLWRVAPTAAGEEQGRRLTETVFVGLRP